MVVHHDVGMADPAIALDHPLEDRDEPVAMLGLREDRPPVVAASAHMHCPTGDVDPQRACHRWHGSATGDGSTRRHFTTRPTLPRLRRTVRIVALQDLTPYVRELPFHVR